MADSPNPKELMGSIVGPHTPPLRHSAALSGVPKPAIRTRRTFSRFSMCISQFRERPIGNRFRESGVLCDFPASLMSTFSRNGFPIGKGVAFPERARFGWLRKRCPADRRGDLRQCNCCDRSRRCELLQLAGPGKPVSVGDPRLTFGVGEPLVSKAYAAISSLRANHTPGFDLA